MTVAKIRYWHCPSCDLRDRTEQAEPNRFHMCPALGGLAVPLVEVGSETGDADARHLIVMREDYARGADPVAAVRTERGDGSNDVTVLAPTARGGVKA